MSPDAAFIACRFLHSVSLMVLWGGSAYLAWLVPARLAGMMARRLLMLAAALLAVSVMASLAALPVETARLGDGWADVMDGAVLRLVLFDTQVGRALLFQAALCLVMLALVFHHRTRRPAPLALTAGLALSSLALTGHSVGDDGMLGVAHMANDALHLLSGGAWLGALVPLLAILRMAPEPSLRREAGSALVTFSRVGHIAVAIVILTGVTNMMLVLGHLPMTWESPYQTALAIKIIAVAAMTALALANRYIVVPRLSNRSGDALAAIRRLTVAEIVLGVLAVSIVAVFGTLEPI